MDNPFFTALEGNGFDAATLAKQTNDVLVPFINCKRPAITPC